MSLHMHYSDIGDFFNIYVINGNKVT